MDEQTLNNQQVTPAAAQAAATPAAQQTTPLQSSVAAQPAENLPAGVSDYSAQIAQMYDAQMAAKQQSMEDAYNQNMTTMQRARDQIAPTYFNQGNDLATQYERTRRNNNMRADMNGLNTGTASQMDLAQQSNYLDAFGQIRTAQANAERQADQQIADLEVAYKSQVAQALADNDYQKATALLQEYQRRDNAAEEMRRYNQQQAMADAKLRAAYGDFGGYADMYGQDTANAMQKYWAMNNPDYAYAMGLISASEYQAMTGMAPGGYSSGGSSGGSYYRRSGGGGGGGGSPETGGPGPYDPNAEPETGSNAVEVTPEQALRIAAGVVGGDISQSQELQSAYQKYAILNTDAKNAVRNSGVDPNSEEGKALVDRYIELSYSDPYVSLDDVKSLQTNRTNNAQTAAVTGRANREAQYGRAGNVTYDWNAEQTGAQAAAAATSASKYTPPAATGKVSAGTRTPGATGMSPTNAASYAVAQNLPALQQLWSDTKAALSSNKVQTNTKPNTTAKKTTTATKPSTAAKKTVTKTTK